jgi:protein phosphatase
MLSEETILNICLQPASPQIIINTLIDQAKQAGGYDNITAIFLQHKD